MSRVGLEPTIPVFELARTVHTLDRVATVVGSRSTYSDIKYRPAKIRNFYAHDFMCGAIKSDL
jgi:hypothetical protein